MRQTFNIVGVSFVPGYPANLLRLADMVTAAEGEQGWSALENGAEGGMDAVLIRNPENEYDTNAVEVHVPALGRSGSMIGHVPAELATRLAPSLDRGDKWLARLSAVLIKDGHTDRPGASLTIECVERSDEQLLRGA